MATLQQAITQIQTLVGALTGIKKAPATAPESINQFPFAVCYPESGTWELQAGVKKGLHTVVIEIHVARVDLPRDIATALGYSESVVNTLMGNPTLAGMVDTITGPVLYRFGSMHYAGQTTLGWQFRVTMKQQSAIT